MTLYTERTDLLPYVDIDVYSHATSIAARSAINVYYTNTSFLGIPLVAVYIPLSGMPSVRVGKPFSPTLIPSDNFELLVHNPTASSASITNGDIVRVFYERTANSPKEGILSSKATVPYPPMHVEQFGRYWIRWLGRLWNFTGTQRVVTYVVPSIINVATDTVHTITANEILREDEYIVAITYKYTGSSPPIPYPLAGWRDSTGVMKINLFNPATGTSAVAAGTNILLYLNRI